MRSSVLGFLCLSFTGFAQSNSKGTIRVKKPEMDSVYTIVDQMPEFPGGWQQLMYFIGGNIRYPVSAMEKGLSGTVAAQFIINTDGTISGARVLNGVPGCPECDAEALRVINLMPAFKPGMNRGGAVRVLFNLPIKFKLK